jgi:chaperonin GroES
MTKSAAASFSDVGEAAEKVASAYVSKEERVLDPTLLDKALIERIPNPTGWRLVVLPYRGRGKTEGGILLPDNLVDDNHIATQVGYVLKVGPLAYKDPDKFSGLAWCKEKDWVMFARYAGSRFRIDGGEVRILNDDEILATISNPEDVLHI